MFEECISDNINFIRRRSSVAFMIVLFGLLCKKNRMFIPQLSLHKTKNSIISGISPLTAFKARIIMRFQN